MGTHFLKMLLALIGMALIGALGLLYSDYYNKTHIPQNQAFQEGQPTL